MSRKKREITTDIEDSTLVETQNEVKSDTLDFRKALNLYKKNNPEKALLMKDIEVIKVFVTKHIPALEANENVWNRIFEKF